MQNFVNNKHVNFSKEKIEKIQRAVVYLTEKQRQLIYLRFWENMSINQVASRAGLSLAATDYAIDCAVSHLKRILIEDEVTRYQEELKDHAFSKSKAA